MDLIREDLCSPVAFQSSLELLKLVSTLEFNTGFELLFLHWRIEQPFSYCVFTTIKAILEGRVWGIELFGAASPVVKSFLKNS